MAEPRTATVDSPRGRSTFAERRPGVLAFLLVCAHLVLVCILLSLDLSISLALSQPDLGRNGLSRLGPAPGLAAVGAFVPVLLSAAAAFVVTFSRRPERAAVAVVIGMGASVVLCGAGLAFLHAPSPVIGG